MSEADARRANEAEDDAPDIPPALSETEWLSGRAKRETFTQFTLRDVPETVANGGSIVSGGCVLGIADSAGVISVSDSDALAALIALANEALRRMDDPRAIRREHVALLRQSSDALENHHVDLYVPTDSDHEPEPVSSALLEFADAIESYLQPIVGLLNSDNVMAIDDAS